MGDLISRKELLRIFSRNRIYKNVTNAEGKNVLEIIQEQPTAYDVDKVVNILQLTAFNEPVLDNGVVVGNSKIIPLSHALQIVKDGG